jgi:hypothetical protein
MKIQLRQHGGNTLEGVLFKFWPGLAIQICYFSWYSPLYQLYVWDGGGMQQCSWLRHYATSWKVRGLIPNEIIEFSIELILPAALRSGGQLNF